MGGGQGVFDSRNPFKSRINVSWERAAPSADWIY